MILKRPYLLLFMTLVIASLLLAGCSPGGTAPSATQTVPTVPETQPVTVPTPDNPPDQPEDVLPDWEPGQTKSDAQGAVEVLVTPINLNAAEGRLEFEVSLNTHSVDLSMDLAQMATLTTDTGVMVTPLVWDAPLGGHHVEGKLAFPAMVNGENILAGARELQLTISGLDAPERKFVWQRP